VKVPCPCTPLAGQTHPTLAAYRSDKNLGVGIMSCLLFFQPLHSWHSGYERQSVTTSV
jgi:hypothetical protein